MRTAAATLPRLALRVPRLALALPGRWRLRVLMLAVLATGLAALYVGWFRDSTLVSVQRVTVAGLDTPDGPRLRAELAAAARRMTTLHVDQSALRSAVRGEPLVRSLSTHSDFPHGLRIDVVENRPVATLSAGGRQLPVAPDGTLLPGARSSAALPAIALRALPRSGGRVGSPSVRQLVAVAGAAPPRLLGQVATVTREAGRGLVVQLRRGPSVWFGAPFELAAKWRAATAVLAQRSSRGAQYVDVRLPGRPVAGGFAGLGDAGSGQPLAQASAAPGSVPGAPPPIAADPVAPPPGLTGGPAAVQPAAPAPQVAAPGQTAASTPATTTAGKP